MAWRVSYWDKKGDLVVHDNFISEDAAVERGIADLNAGLVDGNGNFGLLVDEYRPMPVNLGLVIDA